MRTRDWQVRLIQLLAVPGLLLSFYLLQYHSGSLVAACGISGWDNCGKVSGPDAPYSAIGPVPVALLGLIGYGAIFLMIWLKDWWEPLADWMPAWLLSTTGLALLITAGLTGLELFVIHAFCRYCLVSAGIVVIMFLLALSYYFSAPDSEVAT